MPESFIKTINLKNNFSFINFNSYKIVDSKLIGFASGFIMAIAATQVIRDSMGNAIGQLHGGGNQVYIPKVKAGWFQ